MVEQLARDERYFEELLRDIQEARKAERKRSSGASASSQSKEREPKLTRTYLRNPSWKRELLGNLPSSYGRSYDEKFWNVTREFGLTEEEALDFYMWLTEQSFREDIARENRMLSGEQFTKVAPWEQELLRDVPGETYAEKWANVKQEFGLSDEELEEFRQYLRWQHSPVEASYIEAQRQYQEREKRRQEEQEAYERKIQQAQERMQQEREQAFEELREQYRSEAGPNIYKMTRDVYRFIIDRLTSDDKKPIQLDTEDTHELSKQIITLILDDIPVLKKRLTDEQKKQLAEQLAEPAYETGRMIGRMIDNLLFGLPEELFKRMEVEAPWRVDDDEREGFQRARDVVADVSSEIVKAVLLALLLRGTPLGAKSSSIGQLAKEGAVSEGILTGAEELIDALITPEDTDVGESLKRVGTHAAIGAVADPAIDRAFNWILSRLARRGASEAAEESVDRAIRELTEADTPQFPEPPKQLMEPLPQLPEPKVRFGADPVEIEGIPLLPEARTADTVEREIQEVLEEFQKKTAQLDEMEEAFVAERLAPYREYAERHAQAMSEWESIKELRQTARDLLNHYGKMYVPESAIDKEIADLIPRRFRAGKQRKHAVDIFRVAEDLGFERIEDFVDYLRNLDNAFNVRLKDLMPPDTYKISPKELEKLEEAVRREFRESEIARNIDAEIESLIGRSAELEQELNELLTPPTEEGEPLRFVREVIGYRDQMAKRGDDLGRMVSYVGRIDPEDQVATGYRGSYRVERINQDRYRVVPTSDQEATQSPEFRRAQTDADGASEMPRDAGRQGRQEPVGITPGRVDPDTNRPIAARETFWRRVKKGRAGLRKLMDDVKQAYFDALQPVKDMQTLINKLGDDVIWADKQRKITKVDYDLYKTTRELNRTMSKATHFAENTYGQFFEKLRKANIDIDDFDDYVLAKHAQDIYRSNRDKAIRAGQIMEELEHIERLRTETFDRPPEGMTRKQWSDELTRQERELLRELDELEPYILPADATEEWVERTLKRFEGNKRIEELQQEFVKEQRKDLYLLQKAGVYSKADIERMIQAHPNYISMSRDVDPLYEWTGGRFRPIKSVRRRGTGSEDQIISPTASAIRNRIQHFMQAEKNKALKETLKNLSEIPGAEHLVRRVDPVREPDIDTSKLFRVFENGKPVYYELPPTVKNALDTLTTFNKNHPLLQLIEPAADIIRKGATSWNLDFILRAAVRDTPEGLVFSRTRDVHRVDLAIWDSLLGYLDALFGKNLEKFTGGRIKSYKDAFMKEGGGLSTYIGNFHYISLDKRSVEKARDILYKGKKGYKVLNPFRLIERFGQSLEYAPKLAEYRSAKRVGLPDREAMFEAVDIFDYTKKGEVTQRVGRVIPFLNPTMLGIGRVAQAFAENKARFIAAGFMYFTVPTILAYANRFAPWATEEQRSKIRNAPTWQKNMFWHIPIPSENDTVLLIPKAHIIAQIFANPIERILDGIFMDGQAGIKNPDKFAKETISDLASSLTPPMGLAGVTELVEAMANKDFYMDMPIEDQAMQQLPPEERYNVFTSELAKELGQITGLSPARIDHVIKGLTGGLGRDILDTIDNILAEYGIVDRPAKYRTTAEILNPLEGFIFDDTTSSGITSQLYDIMLRQGDELEDDDFLKIADELNRELNKMVREIREDTEMSSAEKNQAISEIRAIQRELGDILLQEGYLTN